MFKARKVFRESFLKHVTLSSSFNIQPIGKAQSEHRGDERAGVRSRQANPECQEKHVIGKKTSLGNTIQGPSGKRTSPGKGWPPAGSEHCVVVSDGGTKRMERVLKPCD
jgi:hypothetical protein